MNANTHLIFYQDLWEYSANEKNNNKQPESILKFPWGRHTCAHALRKKTTTTNLTWFFSLYLFETHCLLLPLIMCNASVAQIYMQMKSANIYYFAIYNLLVYNRTHRHTIGNLRDDITFFWCKYFQYVIHLSINSTYFNL